jgi:chemotaxis protein MotB
MEFRMTTLARLRRPFLTLCLLAVAPFAGCASQAEIDRLNEANRALTDQNTRLQSDLEGARNEIIRLGSGSIGKEGAVAELQRQLREALAQRDRAIGDLKGFEGRLGNLQFGEVDPEMDRALTTLAEQYPELFTYDRASGMIRVNSDLTFDSGQANVKSAAKPALQALARVLTSGPAQAYDVVIEGHTDSQRISSGTAQRHPTNRHLSAHRAIAVLDEMRGLGVNPQKMMAAGWGEFRPAVPNNPNGNTPANRRVELFLVKSRGTFTPTVTETPAAPVTNNEIIK